MGRVFLTIILPLLLPTLLFVLWRLAAGRAINLSTMWVWLIAGGLVLCSVTLVLVSVDFRGERAGKYVPPQLRDGLIVPGHIEPAPQR